MIPQPIMDLTGFRVTKGVPPSEFCKQFVQGMVDRMAMSFFKYGRVADAYPKKVDAIASLERRLAMYKQTGNGDWLMDVANFAMIEFMHPRHPDFHFRPTDSHESPGRANVDGTDREQGANTLGHENVRRGGSNMVTTGGFYKNEGD